MREERNEAAEREAERSGGQKKKKVKKEGRDGAADAL